MSYLPFSPLNFDQCIEISATLCGLINILLIIRQSSWNFLFGFINAALFFIVFHHHKIYADMSLHMLYMLFQFYGFYQWRKGGNSHHGVMIKRASTREMLLASAIIILLALAIAYVLQHYTDSTRIPLDASSTAICLVAQWMMSKKWLQNWWLWIIADGIAISLYLYKGLYFTTGLYVAYIVMCIIGLICWHKKMQQG